MKNAFHHTNHFCASKDGILSVWRAGYVEYRPDDGETLKSFIKFFKRNSVSRTLIYCHIQKKRLGQQNVLT